MRRQAPRGSVVFCTGGVMSTKEKKYTCPYCEAELQAFVLPEAGGWDQKYHLACFNNDCPYYLRGWNWMLEHYNAKVSYRYRLDPESGRDSPIAVWSETALLDRIIKMDSEPAKKAPAKKPGKKAVKSVKKAPAKKPGKKVAKSAKKTPAKKPGKKAVKPVKKKPKKDKGLRVKPKSRAK